MTHASDLPQLLRRSIELDLKLAEIAGQDLHASFPINPRLRVVLAAAKVSIEHGQSARLLLLAERSPNSGVALVRAQYEALVRSVWLRFCATDIELALLSAPLDLVSEQDAKNMAGPMDMLAEIQRLAPDALKQPLSAFRDAQWKSLNSYAHAGIHPLTRTTGGFPLVLAVQMAKSSSALGHLAHRVCASIAGNDRLTAVTHSCRGFEDCLPSM